MIQPFSTRRADESPCPRLVPPQHQPHEIARGIVVFPACRWLAASRDAAAQAWACVLRVAFGERRVRLRPYIAMRWRVRERCSNFDLAPAVSIVPLATYGAPAVGLDAEFTFASLGHQR